MTLPPFSHTRRSDPVEYGIWYDMIRRCCNPKRFGYERYGGRGISVCEEWRNSFDSFFLHVGIRPSPKYTIDRKNNDGNYEPGNVRWATRSEQTRNSRNVLLAKGHRRIPRCPGIRKRILYDSLTLNQWAQKLGIKSSDLCTRIRRMGIPRALQKPIRRRTK